MWPCRRCRPATAARYFGSIPDLDGSRDGYELAGVAKGGPAERAGFRRGDVIVQFGQSKIAGLVDFDAALRTYHGGEHIRVAALRNGKPIKNRSHAGGPHDTNAHGMGLCIPWAIDSANNE